MVSVSPQEYLKNRLETCSKYELTDADKEYVETNGLRDYLYKQITRKKFRKWKLAEEAKRIINKALEHCIPGGKKIVFRFPFGGYKLWRFESSPEVDWAEFFTISHIFSYLAPIIAAYKSEIHLTFPSDDVFVEKLNNTPKENTQKYYESFQKLLDSFRMHLPPHVTVDMFRHSELYKNEDELERELSDAVESVKSTWKSGRSKEDLEREMKTSLMNINWDGSKDLTGLSETEKNKKVEEGVMYHDALLVMKTRKEFNYQPEKIHLFTEPFSKYVAIGSTKTSIVRFWVGTGVLEKREDSFKERILSITQYDSLKDVPYKEEEVNLIPLKNFETIKVYEEEFDFSR